MSDGVIYTLHHLLWIMGHGALGGTNYSPLLLCPSAPLPLCPSAFQLSHLPISPFLHRAIARKYAATGI